MKVSVCATTPKSLTSSLEHSKSGWAEQPRVWLLS